MEDTYVQLINCRLHLFRSSASSFSSQYLLLVLKSSRSCVLLLPTHFTSVICPSMASSRRRSYNSQVHSGQNNNVTVFQCPFHIFMSFANLWLIRLQGQFPILGTRSFPDLYPLIRPPLAFGRERILIPGFIRSPPTLAVYDIVHSLPLGGAFLIPLWYF